MSRKLRKPISLAIKLRILKEVSEGKKKTEIAKEFKIPKSTLSTIIKDKPKILRASMCNNNNKSRRRLRKSFWPELDSALITWITSARSKNLPLSGPVVKAKAQEFALRLGISNFVTSEGWLYRFRKRNNLSFRRICGEARSCDLKDIEEWQKTRMKEILRDYSEDDIYNADETALFYKQLPNTTLAFKDDPCSGGKLSKERLTVLVCANMSGKDKQKLLVIGKFKKPRCFKGMNVSCLPVTYKNSKKAWINTEIFSAWVRQLDERFHRQKRKVILLIDNCSAHCYLDDLNAITLEFLPPNSTAIIQPCDQGIILTMKQYYRKRLLRKLLLCMDSQMEYQVDILKALFILYGAWEEVSSSTITNCFKHCGFVNADTVSEVSLVAQAPSENDLEATVDELKKRNYPFPDGFNINSYVQVDNAVSTCLSLNSEIEENIISDIISCRSSCNDSDSNDDSVPVPKPKNGEVLNSLNVLNTYIAMEQDCSLIVNNFHKVEKTILSSLTKRLRQMSIDNYFNQQ